jgi:hypothetical protein
VPFTVQKLTVAPFTVAAVTVAELMVLPPPPISLRSIDASFEQSTTGFTTANGVLAALSPPVLLLLPPPHAATVAATMHAASNVSNRLGSRALMVISLTSF